MLAVTYDVETDIYTNSFELYVHQIFEQQFLDDAFVQTKARAAEEMAVESGVGYIMYPGSKIMKAKDEVL